jgi:hypothetical protein
VLAIFSLQCDARIACRQAAMAVGLMARNLRRLNVALVHELPAAIVLWNTRYPETRLIPCAPRGSVAPDDQARRRP